MCLQKDNIKNENSECAVSKRTGVRLPDINFLKDSGSCKCTTSFSIKKFYVLFSAECKELFSNFQTKPDGFPWCH
jgi:hypothetical protein